MLADVVAEEDDASGGPRVDDVRGERGVARAEEVPAAPAARGVLAAHDDEFGDFEGDEGAAWEGGVRVGWGGEEVV